MCEGRWLGIYLLKRKEVDFRAYFLNPELRIMTFYHEMRWCGERVHMTVGALREDEVFLVEKKIISFFPRFLEFFRLFKIFSR